MLGRLLSFELTDSFLQQPVIQVKPYSSHVPMLFCSQDIPCTPNLQVTHGQFKTRPEFGKLLQCSKSLFRLFGQHLIPRKGEIGVGQAVGTADPTAQLVELGQPKPVSILHNQCIDIRKIQPALNDGGADQTIELFV